MHRKFYPLKTCIRRDLNIGNCYKREDLILSVPNNIMERKKDWSRRNLNPGHFHREHSNDTTPNGSTRNNSIEIKKNHFFFKFTITLCIIWSSKHLHFDLKIWFPHDFKNLGTPFNTSTMNYGLHVLYKICKIWETRVLYTQFINMH